jgi:Co/Zn/Cd efflux system component
METGLELEKFHRDTKDEVLTELEKEVETVKEENRKVIKKLIIVSVICTLFMISEVVGGFIANSLAIMTDAAHLLSDLLGFGISIGALLIG